METPDDTGNLKPKGRRINLKEKRQSRQDFVRKEAQVQWLIVKIPFITGGPGPAEKDEPHRQPKVIT